MGHYKRHKYNINYLNRNQIQIIAPIPIPKQDIICLGENYVEHAKESAKFKNENYKSKSSPIYFSKRVNRAVGAAELIHGHSHIVDSLDYEVELAVIIVLTDDITDCAASTGGLLIGKGLKVCHN